MVFKELHIKQRIFDDIARDHIVSPSFAYHAHIDNGKCRECHRCDIRKADCVILHGIRLQYFLGSALCHKAVCTIFFHNAFGHSSAAGSVDDKRKVVLIAVCPVCFCKGLAAHSLIQVGTVKDKLCIRVFKHMLYALLSHCIGNRHKGTAAFHHSKLHRHIFHGLLKVDCHHLFFFQAQCPQVGSYAA